MNFDLFGQVVELPFWIPLGVWFLGVFIYGVLTFFLNYHWKKYSLGNDMVRRARTLYFIITPALLGLALIALIIGYVQS